MHAAPRRPELRGPLEPAGRAACGAQIAWSVAQRSASPRSPQTESTTNAFSPKRPYAHPAASTRRGGRRVNELHALYGPVGEPYGLSSFQMLLGENSDPYAPNGFRKDVASGSAHVTDPSNVSSSATSHTSPPQGGGGSVVEVVGGRPRSTS